MAAPMRFTTFAHFKESRPVTYESWEKFLELFEIRETNNKHSVPLYCPAEFANDRRLAENVLHINFGVLDIDQATEEEVLDAVESLIGELDLQVIVHSTHSHAEALERGLFKCRIIIPFNRPVEFDEWDKVWNALNILIGGMADEQCKNPNAIYFFPSCPEGQGDTAFVDIFDDGEPLDIDDVLQWAPEVSSRTSAIVAPNPRLLERIESSVRFQLAKNLIEVKFPPLVGEGKRNNTAFRVALTCGDFALQHEEAWQLLAQWNATLQPDKQGKGGPFDEDDLRAPLDSAYARTPDGRYLRRNTPFGWRLINRATTDAVTETHLKELAKKWAKKDTKVGATARLLQKVLSGDAIGVEPEAIYTDIAKFLGRHFMHADHLALATLMERSLQATNKAGHRDVDVEWMGNRIEQAQDDWHEEQTRDLVEIQERDRAIIEDAFTTVGIFDRVTPYTKSELAEYAQAQGLKSVKNLRRRWVIRFKKHYYFFIGGQYTRAYEEGEASNMAQVALRPARLDLHRETQNGTVPLRMSEIVERYGSVANKIQTKLSAQISTYNARTKVLTEAPCPFRPLEPEFNANVEKWFYLLCNEEDQLHQKFLDWCATSPLLDRPTSCLFLYGVPHSGKGLFAEGVGRMWITPGEGNLTELENVAGNFNEKLGQCPIIFGDEEIPKNSKGDPNTYLLRRLIPERSRTFKRKHLPDTTLIGAARFVIGANNSDILINRYTDLTNNDIEAIEERFLSIHIQSQAARNFLKELSEQADDESDEFFNGDTIPKHILWLHHNRKVKLGSRFLVAGQPNSTLGLKLMTQSGRRGELCEWLTKYLLSSEEKQKIGTKNRPLVDVSRQGEKRFLVTAEIIYTLWSQFVDTEKPRSSTVLGRALPGMTHSLKVKKKPSNQHYHHIDLFRVKFWALSNGCSENEFDAALERLGLDVPVVDSCLLEAKVEEDVDEEDEDDET